jgi:hypothetical protein
VHISKKINNFNHTRGNSIKNRAQSTMHFQIKYADFKGREFGVEEEERI